MAFPDLAEILSVPGDVRLCARALGAACLNSGDDLNVSSSTRPALAAMRKTLEEAVANVELDWWRSAEDANQGFAGLLTKPAVEAALTSMNMNEVYPAIAGLAILRGICRNPLNDFFVQAHGVYGLCRGDAVPKPERKAPQVRGKPTPNEETEALGTLLEGTPFSLYGGCTNRTIRVCLDFRDRDNLDAATWSETETSGRVPIMASVHPYESGDALAVREVTEGTFFWAGPAAWDSKAVLAQLACAAKHNAKIAILPELSLPAPDALAEDLRDHPADFPELVVCGSAHCERQLADGTGPVRENEARVYLSGALLLVHRKIKPFKTGYLGEQHRRAKCQHAGWLEDICDVDRVITVAAGTTTRLATVICSDLNGSEVPWLLLQAGVNLLLVPALTPHPGAFEGVAALASYRQATAVIVNGTPLIAPERRAATNPFMVLTVIPVDHRQVHQFYRPPESRRAIGILKLDGTQLEPAWF